MGSGGGSIVLCILSLLLILFYVNVFEIGDGYDDTGRNLFPKTRNRPVESEASEIPAHNFYETKNHGFVATEKLVGLLHSPSKIAQFNFSQCTMTNCFDFSKCQADGPIRVHIASMSSEHSTNFSEAGESNIIHASIIRIISQSKYYEPNPRKACLFLLGDDTLDRDPLSKSFKIDLPNLFSSEYHYGLNHLVFNLYSGSWPDYRENDFSGFNIGAAILAKASNSHSNHRSGFDISLPLFSHRHPADNLNQAFAKNTSSSRSYLLTFKGKRYVHGINGETRNSLHHLNNGRDVILLTTCRHGKWWRETIDDRCSQDDTVYDGYDFAELMMRSRFCLIPRGRRLGSFRYLEAMNYGCIPVVLSDGWVKPFDEIIDWSKAVVQLDEDMILLVPDILRDIDKSSIKTMQTNIRAIYYEHFSTVKKIILTTLSIIERRIKEHRIRLGSDKPEY